MEIAMLNSCAGVGLCTGPGQARQQAVEEKFKK